MPTDPQFVTALSSGLEILRCFTPNEPVLTNAALARVTGMPRSSVSRLCYTLLKLGYLDYDASAGTYRLGLSVLSLQPAAVAGTRITQHFGPLMEDLADRVGGRVLLTVYENFGLTVLHGVCTDPEIAAPQTVGFRYGLPGIAMGRAYMGSCSESEREKIVVHLARGDDVRADVLRVEAMQAAGVYRSRSYCTSMGEVRPGNHSISVTVNMSHLGRRIALACGGPAARFSERVLHGRVAPLLLQTAADIEKTSSRLSQARPSHGRMH